MKEFIRNPIFAVIMFLALIFGACVYVIQFRTHEVTYEGIVIEHNTTSDRAGNIEYYTVATFNDGNVRSLRGLGYYVQPIGTTIYYTTREFN